MDMLLWVLAVLVALGVGVATGYFLRRLIIGKRREVAEDRAAQIIAEAEEKQRQILLEAREESLQIRSASEKEARERLQEVQRQERRWIQREEALEQRISNVERREQALAQREKAQERALEELEELRIQALRKLEEVAAITQEQARELIFQRAEEEAKHELAPPKWSPSPASIRCAARWPALHCKNSLWMDASILPASRRWWSGRRKRWRRASSRRATRRCSMWV